MTADVVFLGDSLTDVFALKKYYPEYSTFNRGISGDTSYGLLSRMKVSAYDALPDGKKGDAHNYDTLLAAENDFDKAAETGRNGGYYISQSYRLPSGFMTENEFNAVIAALSSYNEQISSEVLSSAIEKISSARKSDEKLMNVSSQ